MAIGPRIAALRGRAGLSQEELAKQAGIGRSTLGNLERGLTPEPHLTTIYRIAEVLGVDASEIIGQDSRNSVVSDRVAEVTPTVTAQPGQPAHGVPLLMAHDLHQWDWSDFSFLSRITTARGLTDSSDPRAFFLVASSQELLGPSIPAGASLLIEPGEPIRDGCYVLVKGLSGPALRRYARAEGHPELRELHPDQSRVEYVRGLRMLVVVSYTVQLK